MLEKCIKKRLIVFPRKHCIISENQFGSRESLRTGDPIYKISHIFTNVDKSKKTLAIFLDLTKAFHTVSIIFFSKSYTALGTAFKLFDCNLEKNNSVYKNKL